MLNGDLGTTLIRLRHLRDRYLHPQLSQLGIFKGQPGVLYALEEVPGISQSELTRRIHVRPPTITRMVERMTGAGLLERVSDRKDRRVNRLFLTNAGLEVARRMREVCETERDQVFSVLSPEEHQQLVSLLGRIADKYAELVVSTTRL